MITRVLFQHRRAAFYTKVNFLLWYRVIFVFAFQKFAALNIIGNGALKAI
jgi:hypothetical protein